MLYPLVSYLSTSNQSHNPYFLYRSRRSGESRIRVGGHPTPPRQMRPPLAALKATGGRRSEGPEGFLRDRYLWCRKLETSRWWESPFPCSPAWQPGGKGELLFRL